LAVPAGIIRPPVQIRKAGLPFIETSLNHGSGGLGLVEVAFLRWPRSPQGTRLETGGGTFPSLPSNPSMPSRYHRQGGRRCIGGQWLSIATQSYIEAVATLRAEMDSSNNRLTTLGIEPFILLRPVRWLLYAQPTPVTMSSPSFFASFRTSRMSSTAYASASSCGLESTGSPYTSYAGLCASSHRLRFM